MLALIDADIVLHRCGYTTDEKRDPNGNLVKEQDPQWVARARCNEMLEGILQDTNATEYQLWLSDRRENNFRYKLWDGYKANRKDQKRPVHYDYIKELLIVEWGARIAHDQEADDALGINQDPFSIICSIDKDLKQIPGKHYNFVTKEWDEVTPEQGQLKFYTQLLTGDTTDNIKGCRGIGPVKAGKALYGTDDSLEMWNRVVKVYEDQQDDWSSEDILSHILLAGRLLKIRQQEEEIWHFPQSKPCQEIWS